MITNRFLIDMVSEAITDIHIELSDAELKITKRKYKHTLEVTHSKHVDMFSYLKTLSNFDVTRRGSQTGVFEWIVKGKSYQFRFSAIQQNNHVSGVLRLLNAHDVTNLSMITEDEDTISKVSKLMEARNGIILITGKTGSGKSTSLFYFLHFLTNRMVYTLENPIERYNSKWVQIETQDPEKDVTQLLRHDPDVIVLGEIRSDNEIKGLMKAGLSGHFVLSTMHAGSPTQAIYRLKDLGVSMYDISEMLVGVIHQDMEMKQDGKVELSFDIKNSEEIKKLIQSAHHK